MTRGEVMKDFMQDGMKILMDNVLSIDGELFSTLE